MLFLENHKYNRNKKSIIAIQSQNLALNNGALFTGILAKNCPKVHTKILRQKLFQLKNFLLKIFSEPAWAGSFDLKNDFCHTAQ